MYKIYLTIFTSLLLLNTHHSMQAMAIDKLLCPTNTTPTPPIEWPTHINNSANSSDHDIDTSNIKKRKLPIISNKNEQNLFDDAQLMAALSIDKILPKAKKRITLDPEQIDLIVPTKHQNNYDQALKNYVTQCPQCGLQLYAKTQESLNSNLRKHLRRKFHPGLTEEDINVLVPRKIKIHVPDQKIRYDETSKIYYIKCPECPQSNIFQGKQETIVRSNLKRHLKNYHN